MHLCLTSELLWCVHFPILEAAVKPLNVLAVANSAHTSYIVRSKVRCYAACSNLDWGFLTVAVLLNL